MSHVIEIKLVNGQLCWLDFLDSVFQPTLCLKGLKDGRCRFHLLLEVERGLQMPKVTTVENKRKRGKNNKKSKPKKHKLVKTIKQTYKMSSNSCSFCNTLFFQYRRISSEVFSHMWIYSVLALWVTSYMKTCYDLFTSCLYVTLRY